MHQHRTLKIAAIHDLHKSLGITLQFVGRFARVQAGVGDATVVVGRSDAIHDDNLRSLYSEDPDWNLLIRDLSERATAAEEEASEFDEGFSDVPLAGGFSPRLPAGLGRVGMGLALGVVGAQDLLDADGDEYQRGFGGACRVGGGVRRPALSEHVCAQP